MRARRSRSASNEERARARRSVRSGRIIRAASFNVLLGTPNRPAHEEPCGRTGSPLSADPSAPLAPPAAHDLAGRMLHRRLKRPFGIWSSGQGGRRRHATVRTPPQMWSAGPLRGADRSGEPGVTAAVVAAASGGHATIRTVDQNIRRATSATYYIALVHGAPILARCAALFQMSQKSRGGCSDRPCVWSRVHPTPPRLQPRLRRVGLNYLRRAGVLRSTSEAAFERWRFGGARLVHSTISRRV